MFLSEDRYRDLCLTLDYLENPESNVGWSAVAEKLGGLSPRDIHGVKQQRDRSPTAVLLDTFFLKQYSEKKGVLEALELLRNVCEEIDSHEAKMIIDKEIGAKRADEEYGAAAAVDIGTGAVCMSQELKVSLVVFCHNDVLHVNNNDFYTKVTE